jgi:hypothetical protein
MRASDALGAATNTRQPRSRASHTPACQSAVRPLPSGPSMTSIRRSDGNSLTKRSIDASSSSRPKISCGAIPRGYAPVQSRR